MFRFDPISSPYVYNGEKPILEYNNVYQRMAANLYGKGIDEILMRTDYSVTPNVTLHYQDDHEGSVTHLTDGSGNIIESYRYDAFGAPTILSALNTQLSTSAYGNRFMFTGREYAQKFGVYEYRNRAYHPGLGRFTSEDPMGFAAGDLNLFRYCKNDPLDLTDPTGENAAAVAAALATFEVVMTAYDVKYAIETTQDPLATNNEKIVAIGGAVAGLGGPAGGYGKAANATRRFLTRVFSRDAYAVARAGGKHEGMLRNYISRSTKEILGGIKSYEKRIAEHRDWIAHPEKKVPDFKTLRPEHQKDLINNKWPNDMKRAEEEKAVLEGILSTRTPNSG